MICDNSISRPEIYNLHHLPDTDSETAQVNRNMGRICNQVSLVIDQGAGKIQPFLNIYRKCSPLQHGPHILGDTHKPAAKEFKTYSIFIGSAPKIFLFPFTGQDDISLFINSCRPIFFSIKGAVLVRDQARAIYNRSWPQVTPQEDRMFLYPIDGIRLKGVTFARIILSD